MNPDTPYHQRQELEARLTALLLGELSSEEAATVREAIAQDPDLAKLHAQLATTISLVRDITLHPAAQVTEPGAPLRLSEDRRRKLLNRFKTVQLRESVTDTQRRDYSQRLLLALAALLVGLLAIAALLPARSKSKSRFLAQVEASRQEEIASKLSRQSMAGAPALPSRGANVKFGTWSAAEPKLPESYPLAPLNPPPAAQPPPASPAGIPLTRIPQNNIFLPAAGQPTERVKSAAGYDVAAAEGVINYTTVGKKTETGQWSASATLNGFYEDSKADADKTTGSDGFFSRGRESTQEGRPPALSGPTTVQNASQKPMHQNRGNSAGRTLNRGDISPAPEQAAAFRRRYGLAQQERLAEADTQPPPRPAVTPAPASAPDAERNEVEVARNTLTVSRDQAAPVLGDTPVLGHKFQKAAPLAAGNLIITSYAQEDRAPTPSNTSLVTNALTLFSQAEPALGFSPTLPFGALPTDSSKHSTPDLLTASTTATLGDSGLIFQDPSRAGVPEANQRELAPQAKRAQARPESLAREPAGHAVFSAVTNHAEPDVTPLKAKPSVPPPVPQPEIQTHENAFSTFSLNVSDVSFKLAAASLEKDLLPDPAGIRSEEFINAFDYHDPEAPPGVPVAFSWERAQYPFAQNRDLLRFSLKTAAQGRPAGRPLNLVILLDNSGSMERADRVQILHEALRVLATQLQPQDRISVITFARTARLWLDGLPGNQAGHLADEASQLTPQGGTNLEEAMNLAYQTARRHYLADGLNRVVLLTDGAANLGEIEPAKLQRKVEAHRRQGIALDCFGIGWEGYNDDLLEVLSRHGDGRYGFLNTPEQAATEFAGQLAGALHVAASDVKVQVEFNPNRVTAYRQIGYAKHQLIKEQFRDNTVDAAEIAAAEAGNALYVTAVNPRGEGPLAIVRIRYKLPGTSEYREHAWTVPYSGTPTPLDRAKASLRLAATASAFSEWLASSPYATEVTPDRLLACLDGVPEACGADPRPKQLEWMLRQAKRISGR